MADHRTQTVMDLSTELENKNYSGDDIISELRTKGFEDYEIKAGLKKLGYVVTTAPGKIIIISAPVPQNDIPDFNFNSNLLQ
ncbi:hypothetical protein KAU09_05355 [Candidatus Parcubacteria bacterium]|nr:hypothetical protein [Candidatus Parcubacteria bacterium]